MEEAWLHSLSEDWVSQPRSSGSPEPSLPSTTDETSRPSSAAPHASRIPKYKPPKKAWAAGPESNNSPLSERSANDNNVPLSLRIKNPSKLREDISASIHAKGEGHRRTLSDSTNSTTSSKQYNTIQRKVENASPTKEPSETPEWKRRLLHGDVAYGEQKDLFAPAGLESMFQPPPPQDGPSSKVLGKPLGESSIAMPSSPPPYLRPRSQLEESIIGYGKANPSESKKPREMKYKLTDGPSSEFSANDLSRSSTFQPRPSVIPKNRGEDTVESTPARPDSSVVHKAGVFDMAGRAVSGQSDFRNEELSPIYLSRQNMIGGNMDYVAGLPPAELQQRLADFREDTPDHTEHDFAESSQLALEYISADTNDFAHNGRFVNLRRGGRSQEGSFQQHMLSPLSLPPIDQSEMLPEESMQASTPKNLPIIKKTRSSVDNEKPTSSGHLSPVPQTPLGSPSKSNKKETCSGSPLKLFDTYDTFTNQKLLRRLGQFERDSNEEQPSPPAGHEHTGSDLNVAFVSSSSQTSPARRANGLKEKSSKMSSFGEGGLNDYQFSEEVSLASNEASDENDEVDADSLPVLNRDHQAFKFHLEPSPALEEATVALHRTRYTSKTTSTKRVVSIRGTRPVSVSPGPIRPRLSGLQALNSSSLEFDLSQVKEDLETPRKRNGDSEGKRLPISPLKDPTPKRRRTLQGNDLEVSGAKKDYLEADSLMETHQQMQSLIEKKQKVARHGDDRQAATPKVLASRQMLRTRIPSLGPKFNQEDTRPSDSAQSSIDRANLLQHEKIARIQAELDSTGYQNHPKALGANQHLIDGSRKGSITTQDFLDEAKLIMGFIRTRSLPQSGLTSVEESECESGRIRSSGEGEGDSFEASLESTKEPFSRPPSREGAPIQRLNHQQEDPELLDHLRKYQEKSDIDDIIASSVRAIAHAKAETESLKEVDRQLSSRRSFESEPSNIRISENPEILRKRKHSSSTLSHPNGEEVEYPSQASNSSGESSVRSVPTGSSRGSDSRRIIAPHTVSHLIPEQLAGMVFDRERNAWVKGKTMSGESGKLDCLPSDETEGDPFGDIPDLSVDETQELQRLKMVAAELKHTTECLQEHHDRHQQQLTSAKSSQVSKEAKKDLHLPTILERPSFLEDKSKNDSLMAQQHEGASQNHQGSPGKAEAVLETEVEKEISILEDRTSTPVRKRNVTITFSSPLTSVIPQSPAHDTSSQLDMDGEISEESQDEEGSIIITKGANRRISTSFKALSSIKKPSRRNSFVAHPFSTRPVSRIDERDEDGAETDPDGDEKMHERSISVVVATPLHSKGTSSLVLATPRPTHDIGTLTLTPMSDFTIHQEDEELGLNVSYVASNQRHIHGRENQKALSLAIKELVEKLTEVEPYEPFWDKMKVIDLKNKNLSNLHKLDEFCGHLEEVDASNNRLSQLDGVARSVRNLRITHNCLSDLTAWGHLKNLQYIDVSNNELESLSAFKNLVHLRSIRADNNMITSTDGIGQLDALLSLQLRGNLIASVDFKNSKLNRLADLDLKGNRINNVQSLNELCSLSILNLEGNKLCTFSNNHPMMTLKDLRLSGNELKQIDVSSYPNLRKLYLDNNRLGRIEGLLKTKFLDSLSIREQDREEGLDVSFLSEAFEVRKLYLSGNMLGDFKPRTKFLNLQVLELASCGLSSLAPNLGQIIWNTRVLNLNYNALTDITPLAGIVRLKVLYLAGNRLVNAVDTISHLSKWRGLSSFDLRANPLTQGFYPPMTSNTVSLRRPEEVIETTAPHTIARASSTNDAKYAKCLDMETRMMRRMYDMMVAGQCRHVRTVDGLDVDKDVLTRRDAVLDGLIKLGAVSGPGDASLLREVVEVGPSEETMNRGRKRDRPEDTIRISMTSRQKSMQSSTQVSTEFTVKTGKPVEKSRHRSQGKPAAVVQKPREKSAIWEAEDSFA